MNSEILRARYPEMDDPERLYQDLCCAIIGQSSQVPWESLTEDGWKQLEKMAHDEQVDQLLYWNWKNKDYPSQAPKKMILRLGAAYVTLLNRQNQLYSELNEQILPALKDCAHPVVLLKGAALAQVLYPDPALRPMIDLDLLIKKEHQAEIVERLKAIGYCEEYIYPGEQYKEWGNSHEIKLIARREELFAVELHYQLVDSKSDRFSEPDADWFWDHLEPLDIGNGIGMRVYSLDPTAQLFHLSVHLALQHGETQMSLLKYYDIHLLIERWGERIDWRGLAQEAQRLCRSAVLLTALEGCVQRFNTPLPDGYLALLQNGVTHDLISEELEIKSRPGAKNKRIHRNVVNRWFTLRGKIPWAVRVRLIGELFFPQPEYIRRRYHPHPKWLWPFYYLVRWGYAFISSGYVLALLARRLWTRKHP